MGLVYADRVKEVASNKPNASTAFQLPDSGASGGYRSFDSVLADGDTCVYAADNGSAWEVGLGTFTAGSPDSLARTTIHASSNAGAAVDFSGGGDVSVYITVAANHLNAAVVAEANSDIGYLLRVGGVAVGGALVAVNSIGVPGRESFGVGICPAVPSGFTPLAGYSDPAADNYGNYQYSDGSVMVWVPAFYYRIAHASNPTYAGYLLNSVDVKPYSAFADVSAANTAGYALHRAFYDGGSIQAGFFVDKYQASNNSGTASSLKNGNPLSSNSAHNPFSGLTGLTASDEYYHGAFKAAKTRGTRFFPTMRYQYAALALLALAHAQAATSPAWCAWFSTGSTNFPKGCNNGALKDSDDTTVVYVSDGYSNCGKTGSATLFAKTTHNGQNCGVADLNGNVWEVSPGITCIAGTKSITGATQANPVALTVVGHGLSTGAIVMIMSVGGMTQLNDKIFQVTRVDDDTLTLDACNGTAFSAYTSGGTLTYGTFYALNTSATAKDLTGGNTLATDQWGATGVAAHSSAIVPTFRTDYANNGFSLRYGNTTNQVLSASLSGTGWTLTGLGVPLALGASSSGLAAFGVDQSYQYLRNELCARAGGYWGSSSSAGVWGCSWSDARAYSFDHVGFRAASYL